MTRPERCNSLFKPDSDSVQQIIRLIASNQTTFKSKYVKISVGSSSANSSFSTFFNQSAVCKIFVLFLLAVVSVSGQFVNTSLTGRNVCTNRRIGTFVRDVRDCQAYFFCSPDGSALSGRCTPPYMFDEPRQLCNWDNLVSCFACPAQNFVNLPVAQQCDQYVRCVNRQPEHRFCPSDLLFDNSLGQCNVPESVECESAPAPPPCPAISDPNAPIFIRDEEDCNRYERFIERQLYQPNNFFSSGTRSARTEWPSLVLARLGCTSTLVSTSAIVLSLRAAPRLAIQNLIVPLNRFSRRHCTPIPTIVAATSHVLMVWPTDCIVRRAHRGIS